MALMRIYGNRKGARGTFLPTYIFLFQEKRDHIDNIRLFSQFTVSAKAKVLFSVWTLTVQLVLLEFPISLKFI